LSKFEVPLAHLVVFLPSMTVHTTFATGAGG